MVLLGEERKKDGVESLGIMEGASSFPSGGMKHPGKHRNKNEKSKFYNGGAKKSLTRTRHL